jgi:hypothetical protein
MINKLNDYAGVLHIHTSFSDGSGTVREVIDAGCRAKVDFMVISDHNTLKARQAGAEGWYNGNGESADTGASSGTNPSSTLVIVGEEYTRRAGHFLSLNIQSNGHSKKNLESYLKFIHQQGGITFICHPHFGAKPQFLIPDTSWKRWDILEKYIGKPRKSSESDITLWPAGIELWSHLGDWAEDLHWFNFRKHIKHPGEFIEGPDAKTLETWDRLCQSHPLVAIGGLDAHAKSLFPFKRGVILPYYESFKTLRTHIFSEPFSGNSEADSSNVFDALKQGHAYISYDLLASAKGFKYYIADEDEEILGIMGDTLPFRKGMTLKIESPVSEAEIRLIRDGEVIKKETGDYLAYPPEKAGVYRVELTLNKKAWVFSNPLYLR